MWMEGSAYLAEYNIKIPILNQPVKTLNWVLPVIVISQFSCTSLWFTGNMISGLAKEFHFEPTAIGHLISAVQFGFISGTLIYAILGIADRFSPSKVFFISAVLAALSNFAIVIVNHEITGLLVFRFLTGFFLAGIYPVGMKIASDHYGSKLGKVLGFLVGALVIGTALPHLVKSYSGDLLWRLVFIFTSLLSILGGALMLFIPNGQYRKASQRLNHSMLFKVFRNKPFRSAAFGYFGHMWELYTFWAFVPFMLSIWIDAHPLQSLNVHSLSFIIIAGGGIACVASGFLSQKYGSRKTAFSALLLSGICCCISPLMINMPTVIFIIFLIFWGLVVIADSPMFSTLVAQNAPAELKGTALTIVTCIGFSITILSIEMINLLKESIHPNYLFLFLAPGPILGLLAMIRRTI